MPFEIQYDAEKKYVRAKFTGKITMTMVREYIAALIPVLEQHDCSRLLSDSRTAQLQLSALDIMQFPKMAEASPLTARCKRAVLPPPATSGFDMYETMCAMKGHNLQVFSDPDEALVWLLAD